jgi:GcrA cell cycle regulator
MFTWTPERKAKLEQLVADGIVFAIIGPRLGVSKSAAIGAAYRCGFERRPDAPQTKTQRIRAKQAVTMSLRRPSRPIATFPLRGCLYGYGHPGTVEFRFCGAGALPYQAWCAEHRAVVYQKTTQPKETA